MLIPFLWCSNQLKVSKVSNQSNLSKVSNQFNQLNHFNHLSQWLKQWSNQLNQWFNQLNQLKSNASNQCTFCQYGLPVALNTSAPAQKGYTPKHKGVLLPS